MNRVGDSLFCTGANEDIVRTLNAQGAEFIVIGGLAVSWYCPERLADDMDLLVNPTLENSKRVAKALSGLRLSGFDEASFARPALQVPLKQYYYAEILTPRNDGPSYPEIAADPVDAKLFTIPVRLASVRSLICLKEHALTSKQPDRAKHQRDIGLLRGHAE
jgi:hypothetical protein